MARKQTGVAQRGGTWTAYWPRPDGRQGSKGGFATQKDAVAHRSQVTLELHRGTYAEPSKTTLAEWATAWLPAIRSEIRPKTWANYESSMRRHVLPRFGDVRLSRLTVAQVKEMISDLLATRLAKGTVQQIVITLHRCLKDAVAWGDVGLTRNVSDGLASDLTTPRRPLKVWTDAQVRQFLTHCTAAGERWAPAFAVDVATGLRRGELLGLRWDAHVFLDTESPYLLVEDNVVRVAGRVVVNGPKTAAGNRRVTLHKGAVAVLRAHREVQDLERMVAGSAWQDRGLVFCLEDGSHVNPDVVSAAFNRATTAAGLPAISIKNLRHTHATLGLQAGVPLKVMSKRLGHTSIAVTADIYTHVSVAVDHDAAILIGNLMFGDPNVTNP